jgi:hypothetical protein
MFLGGIGASDASSARVRREDYAAVALTMPARVRETDERVLLFGGRQSNPPTPSRVSPAQARCSRLLPGEISRTQRCDEGKGRAIGQGLRNDPITGETRLFQYSQRL